MSAPDCRGCGRRTSLVQDWAGTGLEVWWCAACFMTTSPTPWAAPDVTFPAAPPRLASPGPRVEGLPADWRPLMEPPRPRPGPLLPAAIWTAAAAGLILLALWALGAA